MTRSWTIFAMMLCGALAAGTRAVEAPAADERVDFAALRKIAEVDPRFQSYNVEMVEVTGGRFWAPYGVKPGEMFRQREPLDLADPKLRQLARHLAPAYVRVSGSWASNTYLPLDGEALREPPAGFKQVLTRNQWTGVIDFAKAVDAELVTSFAVSAGTRDADGVWTSTQAQRIAELTTAAGGTLVAAEFFNEPNVPTSAFGVPKTYGADEYSRDFRAFKAWAKRAVPHMKILGPSGVGEGTTLRAAGLGPIIRSEDMMRRDPGSVDAVSYHFYGGLSSRCEFMGLGTPAKEDALKPEWLDRTLSNFDLYRDLRDRYEPGKPLWLTETAQAGCGGSPWAATFLDAFRYLNQNALLASKGVQVVIHNTLSASDYALLDEGTLEPRPNYWAAVLWRRLMGTVVLQSPPEAGESLRLYAHCLRDAQGGVALLALNIGETHRAVAVGGKARAWVMTGEPLDTKRLRVDGREPHLRDDGRIDGLQGVAVAGSVELPPKSITFLAIPGAGNRSCRRNR